MSDIKTYLLMLLYFVVVIIGISIIVIVDKYRETKQNDNDWDAKKVKLLSENGFICNDKGEWIKEIRNITAIIYDINKLTYKEIKQFVNRMKKKCGGKN